MNDAELWGTAEGFSKYLVSNRGRVKVVKTGKLIKQQPYPKRYMSVNIVSDDGKHRWWLVHRLVCTVFSGPCPPGLQARHLDGNPRNNRAENIKWGTASENSLDKYRHGTILRGEDGPNARLTEEDVRQIRESRERGEMYVRIARRYGVGWSHVKAICNREYWAHVA